MEAPKLQAGWLEPCKMRCRFRHPGSLGAPGVRGNAPGTSKKYSVGVQAGKLRPWGARAAGGASKNAVSASRLGCVERHPGGAPAPRAAGLGPVFVDVAELSRAARGRAGLLDFPPRASHAAHRRAHAFQLANGACSSVGTKAHDSPQCACVIPHLPQRRVQLSRHEVQTLLEEGESGGGWGEGEKGKGGVVKGDNRGEGCGQRCHARAWPLFVHSPRESRGRRRGGGSREAATNIPFDC